VICAFSHYHVNGYEAIYLCQGGEKDEAEVPAEVPQTVQAEAVETEGEVALGHLAALACDVCCFSLSCTWS